LNYLARLLAGLCSVRKVVVNSLKCFGGYCTVGSCEDRRTPSRASRMGSEDMESAERQSIPSAITSSPFQGLTMRASRGAQPFPAAPFTRPADERSALTHRSRLHSPCGKQGTQLREMDRKERLQLKISSHGDLCNWFGHLQLDETAPHTFHSGRSLWRLRETTTGRTVRPVDHFHSYRCDRIIFGGTCYDLLHGDIQRTLWRQE
jgi:hypothetical protein